MSEKKGFFSRLFGGRENADDKIKDDGKTPEGRQGVTDRDAHDVHSERPEDDKEKAAATAVEDSEAGADVPLHEALKEGPAEQSKPAQLEDEDNLAPDANADGYREIRDEHAMPAAKTGPAVRDVEARLQDTTSAAQNAEEIEPVIERDEPEAPETKPSVPKPADPETPDAAEEQYAPATEQELQTGVNDLPMDDDMPPPDGSEDTFAVPVEGVVPEADQTAAETIVEEPAADTPREAPQETPKKKGFFARLKDGLSKSSDRLSGGVSAIFTKRKLDDETLEELEDLLISADLGLPATTRIIEALSEGRYDKEISPEEVRDVLATEVARTLEPLEKPLEIDTAHTPHVILMTGVNGAGKTTTIGKLAKKFADDGKSVMLAAGDTFRAAAIEQLEVWGERTGAPVITRPVGSDAAGLAYDALKEAKEQKIDVLMIDTAGRLQNRSELMDELAKIVRVIKKLDERAPHDAILILDATVGQNALRQAEAFSETAAISGLIMTKLDGTARGGVLVALADKFDLPIHYIGVGESVEDLQPFDAGKFARALAGIATDDT